MVGPRSFDATDSYVSHISCRGCGARHDLELAEYPCPDCGGILDPQYDLGAFDIDPATWERRAGSMWKYRELLPVRDAAAVVSMGEGATPLVGCPCLAGEMNVGRLLVKDEGQNPTNTFKDRGQSAAISCAVERGVEEVALPSAGNAGQAASAYAARAGLDCHVFLNHRAGDAKKDLVRAHGGDLRLRSGTIDHAGAAFAAAREEHDWHSVATFETPFRHEGKKTMGFELFESFEWSSPDHVVYPTGGGVGLVGIWKAYRQLREVGWLDGDPPRLHVAQTTGAAPVVEAIREGADEHTPWDDPESVARGVEIPDPGASPWLLDAVSASGGTGVAVGDEAAIESARRMARQGGVEMCVTSAVALAGAFELARRGVFGPDENVVVVNTGAGCKTHAELGTATEPGP